MTAAPVRVAVPRKGRPLEAVLDRVAGLADATAVADDVASTLRYEKAVAKGEQTDDRGVYDRLAAYSGPSDPTAPDYTLLRDDRPGKPRRIVFDSLSVEVDGTPVELVGREEPFRALRTHEFALGFDSADLVLEEVVGLRPEPLTSIADVNDRIDPVDTDVRVVSGLGDTVHHTLLATPAAADAVDAPDLDREFLAAYEGDVCISPRYERLVEAVLGTDVTEGLSFVYPGDGHHGEQTDEEETAEVETDEEETAEVETDEEETAEGEMAEEEAAIAAAGVGVYLTVTGSTARNHGLAVGERLFPSETVLMENQHEVSGEDVAAVRRALTADPAETAIPPQ